MQARSLLRIALLGVGAVALAARLRPESSVARPLPEAELSAAAMIVPAGRPMESAPLKTSPTAAEASAPEPIGPVMTPTPLVSQAPSSPATSVPKFAAVKPPPAEPLSAVPKQPKEMRDPIAREALGFVGEEPEAEAYWLDAINDPSLSAQERQDLIEDLNEEGFEDPHHPTLDDLPMIMSRLELIEQLADDAMDEVNSDAFAEASKDLAKMASVAEQN